MLTNIRCQHGVGQGFFHTAELDLNGSRFGYVYDCGSDNLPELGACVEDYSQSIAAGSSARVNALFVSHLDSDHVSGLDRLLSVVSVDTVFIPYLTPYERLEAVANALDEGVPSGSLVQACTDLVRWFGDRGVARVVFVSGDHEGDSREVPPRPEPEDRGEGGRDITMQLRMEEDAGQAQVTATGRRVAVFRASDRSPIWLHAPDGAPLNWMLLTFAHPERQREREFRECVEREMGVHLADMTVAQYTAWLLGVLQHSGERGRLAACYSKIRGDRNLTSLCLYSGPVHNAALGHAAVRFPSSSTWLVYGQDGSSPASLSRLGWLGTGDADLSTASRRDAFLHHYRHWLDCVLTLALPHHGSRRNFHKDLLQIRPAVCVAAAGAHSRHGHPSPELGHVIRMSGCHMVTVTERDGLASFEEEVRLL